MSVFDENPANDFRFLLKLPDSRLLLSCHGTNSVLVLDAHGQRISVLKDWFSKPEGLALVGNNVYIVDRYKHCVHVFNATTLMHVTSFGGPGQAPGQFNQPVGIAASASGALWVADNENHRVQLVSVAGEHIKTLGGRLSDDPGSFFCPCGVVTYNHPQHGELVLVSEWGGHRVQVFKGDKVFAIFPGIQNAHSLCVDKAGRVCVSEYATACIKRFLLDGESIQLERSAVSLNVEEDGMLIVERHKLGIGLFEQGLGFTSRKRLRTEIPEPAASSTGGNGCGVCEENHL